MLWQLVLLISSSYALHHTLKEPACTNQSTSRTIRLSVNSKRNATGDWMDTLSGWTEVNNSSLQIQTDAVHTITECQGKRIIHFQSISQASSYAESEDKQFIASHKASRYAEFEDKLKFHPRCGKNVKILNDGLTVHRINLEDADFSSVFTNRPLRDNEIFEIKLEGEKGTSMWNLGIGFMTKSPTDVEILSHMFKSEFAWINHLREIFHNGKSTQQNITQNTNTLQVGDRVGVMRSKDGVLHFFYNGKDQGPAMSDVPPNIYGVLDLRGSFEKASIV